MITLINVFTVLSENQQNAFQGISSIYTEVAQHQVGFISAKILIAEDGSRVTAIAQWDSPEHLKAMTTTKEFRDLHTKEFRDAIVSIDSHVYNVGIELGETGKI